jgi:hypothetical protein
MHRTALTVAVAVLVAAGAAAGVAVAATGAALDAGDATPALQENNTTGNDTTGNATDATGDNATAGNATANVTFDNQTSNGSAVVVENATLPEGGFVVVHLATPENQTVNATENETVDLALTRNLTAGAVVGNSTYLEPGEHENVTVTLDQPITDDQYLIATPYRDANGNQSFDGPETDDPYTSDGEPVTDEAYVTVEGNATAGNATANATGNATTNETGNSTVGW